MGVRDGVYFSELRRFLLSSIQGGYIGKPVPCTPTFLGSFLQAKARSTYKRAPRGGYHHMYPRRPRIRARIRQVVKALRYDYTISTNKIAGLLKISTRTVDRHIKELRKAGFKQFNASRPYYRRSKNFPGVVNSKGLFLSIEELKIRLTAFIFGLLDTIEEALGEDPF